MRLLQRMSEFKEQPAVVSKDGQSFTYAQVLSRTNALAHEIKTKTGKSDLRGERVAFLCDPGIDYVVAKLSIFQLGGCAVPLCTFHPESELQYIIDDAEPFLLLSDTKYTSAAGILASKSRGLYQMSVGEYLSESFSDAAFSTSVSQDGALVVYTSGTTGKPKGVVTRYSALDCQITVEIESWGWTKEDRVLNCLPLHHVHGIVNLTLVPLYSGACVEFTTADKIWQRLMIGPLGGGQVTVFMAVPTVYSKLIREFDALQDILKTRASKAASELRLMVCGSAALPTTVMHRWKEITGHVLLERYGMTEFCMGLSNPLSPVSSRLAGYVGNPMPSVSVKIIDQETGKLASDGEPGMLFVSGKTVFNEYWKNPKATRKEFDADGWFNTGDVAAYDPIEKSYRILGRASADIIKTGGYKVSALEIERILLEYEGIDEIAVVGVPDEYYGERVAAVIKWNGLNAFSESAFKEWAFLKLAKYKVPTVVKIVPDIPKNAMGKVAKKVLSKQLFPC